MFETEEVTLFPKAEPNDKIALIDADTIVFGACSVHEYQYFDIEKQEEVFDINLEDSISHAIERVEQILAQTGCKSAELYFTSGMNFRYEVDPNYKSNRKGTRRPEGLYETKAMLLEQFEGKICTKWEADDEVVYLKKKFPDKYILVAVDKDVLKAVPGRHFNYFSRDDLNIQPKFVETTETEAVMHNYAQAIIGDPSDGIKGVPGIGKAKVKNFMNETMTEKEMWGGVVKAFESKGLSIIDALTTYQLVSMHQLVDNENGEPELKLFNPNEEFDDE